MNVKIDELIQLIESKDISHINRIGLEVLKNLKESMNKNNESF